MTVTCFNPSGVAKATERVEANSSQLSIAVGLEISPATRIEAKPDVASEEAILIVALVEAYAPCVNVTVGVTGAILS